MKSIKSILMERDGMTEEEAKQRIAEVQELVWGPTGEEDIADVLMDELGLEPDYLDQLL